MKPYLINDIDESAGALVKRPVDSAWLHQEMLNSAERLRVGSADNLDRYDPTVNPTGCFLHQDVQTVFYELSGARIFGNLEDKVLALKKAAQLLHQRSAQSPIMRP